MDDAGLGVLAKIGAERPRLMATKAAIERAQHNLRHNDTARQWSEEVEKQANLLLELPPLTSSWVHDPRETGAAPLPLVRPPKSTDAPAAPLDIARLFCLRIQTLGIIWLLTGDTRYRDRAKAELLAVCAFPDWAGDNKFLVTAETAFGAAIGYDWLHDSLDPTEREQVARAIVDKAIQPGLDQFAKPKPPYWTTTAMNWNLVCNGGLMVAALSVLEADPRAAQLFSLCRDSVTTGFSEYRPDGGFAEGPGYWHYATQYAIYLLDSLATALGTDLGLDALPGLARTGRFRLYAAGPSGKLFNFADGEEDHSGGYWLFWLAKRYRHPIDASIARHRGKAHPMDLLWFDDHARDPIGLPTAQQFHEAGVVMLRGDWGEPKATYLGIKGGANDACEHGHYDLGSFVLDADGVRWAKDLGPDDYELPGYFTPEMRSRYYRTSTIGHNTIVIGGECQPPDARAVITHTRFGEEISSVVMDLSAAYPSAASAVRGFALIDRRHVLIVDDIVPKECPASLDWQMHTAAEVEIRPAAMAALTVREQSDGAERPRLYLRVIDPGTGTLSSRSAAPGEPQGQNPNPGVAKLVFHLGQVAQRVRLAVLLSPDLDICANLELPLALRASPSDW
ncbi:MAG TPA: heparinase II/III family protein [Stellaceae bacterium]|nr:heparinase II/III family protein [Stellaceae bacterium]